MSLNVENLLRCLPIIGIGYLGIFAVTAVIIVAVLLLNRLTRQNKK